MIVEQFKSQIGDCKSITQSTCPSKSSYETVSSEVFCIFDPPNEANQPVRIVCNDEDHQLLVNNSSGKDIWVVKIDKCLFGHKKDKKKCDCILISDEIMYLVEIKSTNTKGRKVARKEARAQLESTITEIVTEHKIDLSAIEAVAIICFKKIGKTTNVGRNTESEIFRSNNYAIKLLEKHELIF